MVLFLSCVCVWRARCACGGAAEVPPPSSSFYRRRSRSSRRARPQLWSCLVRTPSPKARPQSRCSPRRRAVGVAAAVGRRHCAMAARGIDTAFFEAADALLEVFRRALRQVVHADAVVRHAAVPLRWRARPRRHLPHDADRRRRRPRWRCRPRRRRRARRRRARRRGGRRRSPPEEDGGFEGTPASVTQSAQPIKQTSSFGRRTDSALKPTSSFGRRAAGAAPGAPRRPRRRRRARARARRRAAPPRRAAVPP